MVMYVDWLLLVLGGATVGDTTLYLMGRVDDTGCLVDRLVFDICTVSSSSK